MGKQKKLYDRTGHIFLKKIEKYILFYFIFLILLVPFVVQSYHMARNLTMAKFDQKLEQGLSNLEEQAGSAKEIVNAVRNNSSFRKMLPLSGELQYPDYVTLQNLKDFLNPLFTSITMKTDAMLLFRKSPAFILNNRMSDSYLKMYPLGIEYAGTGAEEWRESLLQQNENLYICPEQKITSYSRNKKSYDGITFVLNASFSTIYQPNAVLAYTVDKQDILHSILPEDGAPDLFAYLYNSEGRLLLTYQYDQSFPLESPENMQKISVGGKKYLITVYESANLGMTGVIGIPEKYFMKNVRGMIQTAVIYALTGGILLAVIALLMALRETQNAKRMYETARNYSGLIPETEGEHEYVGKVLNQMSVNSREQSEKIKNLRNSIQNSVLENLLLFGVYTQREEIEVIENFGLLFERFCVIKSELSFPRDKFPDIGYLSDILYVVENTIMTELESETRKLIIKPEQMVLIVPLSGKAGIEITDIRKLLEDMVREIRRYIPEDIIFHIGISSIQSGILSAKVAYQQAKNAAGMHLNSDISEVVCYREASGSHTSNMFDASVQMKLYDALIAGDQGIADRILNELAGQITDPDLEEEKKVQIYYSLLHAAVGALDELKKGVGEKEEAEEREEVWPILSGNPANGEIMAALEGLREGCRKLTDIVHNRKKYKNSELKDKVLQYIQSAYQDPSLSASSIAKALFISEKYVFSLVKDEMGKPLSKYVEDLRIGKAEDYLLHTQYSNLKIMELCGFGNPQTFYRAFARKHSVSPVVWRSNHLKNI